MIRRSTALVGLLLSVAATACGSPPGDRPAAPDPTLIVVPYPTTGRVVIVAIDNHFHDIHPTDRRVISEDQPFRVRNDGRYRHNFTVLGTDVSVYIEPGEEASWPRIGDVVPMGFHVVVCRIHENVGMGGQFTVVRRS